MKNIVKLIILVAIIFSFQWGCKENLLTENNPIPEQTSILQNAEVQYMHQKLCNQIDEIIGCQVSKTIDGSKGGILNLHNVEHGTLGSVTTSAQLIIPKDAFRGVQNITIVTNSKTASVQFYPPMQFDKPLKLNLIYTGLDIAELDSLGLLQPGQIGFCFVPDHGDIEPILNDGILFKVVGGRLGVNNAQINHFSRYCWCK